MKKFVKASLVLILIAFLASCSGGTGTGGGGGATPAPPTTVPTTIEYSQGDAIISGVVEGLAISADVSAKSSSEGAIDEIVATDYFGLSYPVTVTTDDRFCLALPAGFNYSLVFASGGVKVSTLNIPDLVKTVVLQNVDGAATDGSADCSDEVFAASVNGKIKAVGPKTTLVDVAGVDFGEFDKDTGVPSITASDYATFVGLSEDELRQIKDVWFGLANQILWDGNANEVPDYTEAVVDRNNSRWSTAQVRSVVGMVGDYLQLFGLPSALIDQFEDLLSSRFDDKYYSITFEYESRSTQLVSEIFNQYSTSGAFEYRGYCMTIDSNERLDKTTTGEIFVVADVDVPASPLYEMVPLVNGAIPAYTPIPGAYSASSRPYYIFGDCLGGSLLPDGNYYVVSSDVGLPSSSAPTSFEMKLASTAIADGNSAVIDLTKLAIPKVKLTGSSTDAITGLQYQWVKYSGGSYVNMTNADMLTMMQALNGHVFSVTVEASDASDNYIVNERLLNEDATDWTSGTITFDARPLADFEELVVYYNDQSYNQHRFKWDDE